MLYAHARITRCISFAHEQMVCVLLCALDRLKIVFETVVYWRILRLQLELFNDDHWPFLDVSIDGDDVALFTLKSFAGMNSFPFIPLSIELHTFPEHVGPFIWNIN